MPAIYFQNGIVWHFHSYKSCFDVMMKQEKETSTTDPNNLNVTYDFQEALREKRTGFT